MIRQGKSTDERLADLEKTVAYLTGMLAKATRYAESDPEIALTQARKAAEAICIRLFAQEIGPPGKLMLEDLIGKLQAKRVIPPHVVVPLRTIQGYGNYGAHAQEEHIEVSSEWVAPCLSALATVINWYFTDYLGVALPEAIAKAEPVASGPAPSPAKTAPLRGRNPAVAPGGLRAKGRWLGIGIAAVAFLFAVGAWVQRTTMEAVAPTAPAHESAPPAPVSKPSSVEAEPVASGPAFSPVKTPPLIGGRYRDLGDGTVVDAETRLQWMRCVLGQTWDGTTCVGKAPLFKWDEMFQRVKAFNAEGGSAGHRDWRVPTIDELKTLLIENKRPAIDQQAFPIHEYKYFSFWSSSPYANYANDAWRVHFDDGYVTSYYKGYAKYVRLVRGGQ